MIKDEREYSVAKFTGIIDPKQICYKVDSVKALDEGPPSQRPGKSSSRFSFSKILSTGLDMSTRNHDTISSHQGNNTAK